MGCLVELKSERDLKLIGDLGCSNFSELNGLRCVRCWRIRALCVALGGTSQLDRVLQASAASFLLDADAPLGWGLV